MLRVCSSPFQGLSLANQVNLASDCCNGNCMRHVLIRNSIKPDKLLDKLATSLLPLWAVSAEVQDFYQEHRHVSICVALFQSSLWRRAYTAVKSDDVL